MNKAEKKLVKHLKEMAEGIERGEIKVHTVSATIGDPISIGEKGSVNMQILSFEFYRKPKGKAT
ncbi:hypothetical protein [Undibacterium baiyunense]|uniref:Uncharacterized protein n=1 Tax=Undibacterium baiyunense TaxID=2828731 RepID=A0A941I4G1_9BURK|nr:hypothetical protein [Undibacterium baiyunense]MBR7747441.1 hypothetical protein [Undibacterium baiyunense]